MKVIVLNNVNLLLPNSSSLLHASDNDQDKINSYFDIDFWEGSNLVVGQSKGRNITWFVKSNLSELAWVLRHYYRGGLIAKLINDQYLFASIKSTRVYKEIALLEKMLALGLPVPKPIAGRVRRKGLFYSADLIMEKLDAQDLVALLKESDFKEALWSSIGDIIAQFHNQNIYHSDLNAHNILIDCSDKVWLIDFDKCELRENIGSWKDENMERLNRSFEKEKKLVPSFNYNNDCWDLLKKAYLNKLN